jgi:hypothetical protein
MRRCGLQNVKLVRADLTGADLERSALADTDLRDARMVGCKLGASGLLHARPSGVNLSGATGLARALIEEIDIGPEGAPEILTGEAALARLPRCTKLPPRMRMLAQCAVADLATLAPWNVSCIAGIG